MPIYVDARGHLWGLSRARADCGYGLQGGSRKTAGKLLDGATERRGTFRSPDFRPVRPPPRSQIVRYRRLTPIILKMILALLCDTSAIKSKRRSSGPLARDARIDELKFRLKRLLVTDRRSGRDPNSEDEGDRHYAFYSQEPPGSGTEVMFSGYEAFALLAAITLLEHGLPQAAVVKVMRQVRRPLEAAHGDLSGLRET
jgi:hypothetical protein